VERVLAELRGHGWLVAAEASFNRYGERGSIDVLAFHPADRVVLVVEVKSVIVADEAPEPGRARPYERGRQPSGTPRSNRSARPG